MGEKDGGGGARHLAQVGGGRLVQPFRVCSQGIVVVPYEGGVAGNSGVCQGISSLVGGAGDVDEGGHQGGQGSDRCLGFLKEAF